MDNVLLKEDNARKQQFECSRFDNNGMCAMCDREFKDFDDINCIPTVRRYNFVPIHHECLNKLIEKNDTEDLQNKLDNSQSPLFLYMEVKIDNCSDFKVDDIIYNVKNDYICLLLTGDEFFDLGFDFRRKFIGPDDYSMYLNNDDYAILRKIKIRR